MNEILRIITALLRLLFSLEEDEIPEEQPRDNIVGEARIGRVIMDYEELVQQYEPLLNYSKGEEFYPMFAGEFVKLCSLRKVGETQPVRAVGEIALDALGADYASDDSYYLQFVQEEVQPKIVVPLRDKTRSGLSAQALPEGMTVAHGDWAKFAETGELPPGLLEMYPDVAEELRAYLATGEISEKVTSVEEQRQWEKSTEKNEKTVRSLSIPQPLEGIMEQLRRSRILSLFALPQELLDAAIKQYQELMAPQPQYTYHYRVARAGEYLILQYWFFYAYNNWATPHGGVNDHEGDWETIMLFFPRGATEPEFAAYSAHEYKGKKITLPWNEVAKRGTHSEVWVGRGSHANYFKPAIYDLADYAKGDGITVGFGKHKWTAREPLLADKWVQDYAGGWGVRYGVGNSGPTGPAFKEAWRTPLEWVGR